MRHGRRDDVHKDIVAFFRQCGASVFDAGDVGIGFPDLVVGIWGRPWLVELKTGNRQLRVSQEEFAKGWRGGKISVLRSLDDAKEWIASRGKQP
jgi:hypothetical protein